MTLFSKLFYFKALYQLVLGPGPGGDCVNGTIVSGGCVSGVVAPLRQVIDPFGLSINCFYQLFLAIKFLPLSLYLRGFCRKTRQNQAFNKHSRVSKIFLQKSVQLNLSYQRCLSIASLILCLSKTNTSAKKRGLVQTASSLIVSKWFLLYRRLHNVQVCKLSLKNFFRGFIWL